MGIVRPVMEVHPMAWLFFVPFIVSTTYAVLNLFVGVIVSAMQGEHQAEIDAEHEKRHDENAEILAEVRALKSEIAAIRTALEAKQRQNAAENIEFGKPESIVTFVIK